MGAIRPQGGADPNDDENATEVIAGYRYLRGDPNAKGTDGVVEMAGVNDYFILKAMSDYQAMKLGFLCGECDGFVLDGAPAETVVPFLISGTYAMIRSAETFDQQVDHIQKAALHSVGKNPGGGTEEYTTEKRWGAYKW